MKKLHLENINALTPYTVVENDREAGFYDFITAHGVQYSIGFIEDDITALSFKTQMSV